MLQLRLTRMISIQHADCGKYNMKLLFFITMILILTGSNFQANSMTTKNHDSSNTNKVFDPRINDKWIGIGISYGSYRDGESPSKSSVSSEEDILQDMMLLTANNAMSWNLIRMYAADAASEQVLKTIKKHNLPVKVMQGAWLSSTQTDEENEQQISEVIRLAPHLSILKHFYSDNPRLILGLNPNNQRYDCFLG